MELPLNHNKSESLSRSNLYERIRNEITACGAVTTVFYTRKLNYCRMTELLCGKKMSFANANRTPTYYNIFFINKSDSIRRLTSPFLLICKSISILNYK